MGPLSAVETTRPRGVLDDAVLLALSQVPEGTTLRGIARMTGVRDSSAQYVLDTMIERGFIERRGSGRESRYRLAVPPPFLPGTLFAAARRVGQERALEVLGRANPAVELAALDRRARRLYLLYAEGGDPRDIVRLERALRELLPDLGITQLDRGLLGGTTTEDIERAREIRTRLLRSLVLRGDPRLALPDRSRRGRFGRARPLARLHPTLPKPSRRDLQRLARTYGLAEISVYGSAVRDDFRPGSDVDVVIRYRPGHRPTLRSASALQRDLSSLFGRRVDVAEPSRLHSDLLPTMERDRVRLYGKRAALRKP